MKGYKKILAGVLATSMVMGSSVVVLADEGRTTGSGKVEGSTSDKVFRVELPTIAENDDTFDYIIDPLGLIEDAGADRYGALTFEAGASVFFHNDNKNTTIAKDYASESAPLTVRNYSTDPVDLTVTVKATEVDGITLTDDSGFANDKSTSLYLALQGVDSTGADDSANIDKVGSTGVAQITKQLAAITAGTSGKDPYIIKWNPIRDRYEYVEDDTVTDAVVDQYSFKLTGKCNPVEANSTATTGAKRAEWLEVLESGETPELELIWTVQNPFEATIKLEQDGSDITKRILTLDNLTKEKNYTSVTISDGNEELAVAKEVGGVNWVTDNWNETDGGTLVGELESNWTNWMDGKLLTITLNLTDGSAKTVTVKAP
jgi:hypothetical protein